MRPDKTYGVSISEPSGQAVPFSCEAGMVRAMGTALRGTVSATSVRARIDPIPMTGTINHNANMPGGMPVPLDTATGNWCGPLGAVSGNTKYGIAVWATFGTNDHDYVFHTFKTQANCGPIAACP